MDELVSGIQVQSRPSYSRERNLRRQQAVTIQQSDYTSPPDSALRVAMGALHRLLCALVVSYLSPRTVRALSAPSSRAKRHAARFRHPFMSILRRSSSRCDANILLIPLLLMLRAMGRGRSAK